MNYKCNIFQNGCKVGDLMLGELGNQQCAQPKIVFQVFKTNTAYNLEIKNWQTELQSCYLLFKLFFLNVLSC